MRMVFALVSLLYPVSVALADESCMAGCGRAFNYCIMHLGAGNEWGAEICGDALVQCEKRCESNPAPFVVEPGSELVDSPDAKKK